jgi:hypothetical protein
MPTAGRLQEWRWQSFQPYVMIITAPGEYRKFFNTFTNETYASTVRTNSLGYNDRHEFIVGQTYKKAANEKVVLFTGGSAAWGAAPPRPIARWRDACRLSQ